MELKIGGEIVRSLTLFIEQAIYSLIDVTEMSVAEKFPRKLHAAACELHVQKKTHLE